MAHLQPNRRCSEHVRVLSAFGRRIIGDIDTSDFRLHGGEFFDFPNDLIQLLSIVNFFEQIILSKPSGGCPYRIPNQAASGS